jgi:hypothetical protein
MCQEAEGEEPCVKLTNTEIDKYSRQIIMPEIGIKGKICYFCFRLHQNTFNFTWIILAKESG